MAKQTTNNASAQRKGYTPAQFKDDVIQYWGSPLGQDDIRHLGYKARTELFRRLTEMLLRTNIEETQDRTTPYITEETRRTIIQHLREA